MLGVATAIPCLVMMAIAATPTILMADWLRMVLIIVAIIPFLSACFYCVKIEQVAGYYKCKKCGHRYVPKYSSVLFAPHVNRTRKMRCPKFNQKSWQKKVISKE